MPLLLIFSLTFPLRGEDFATFLSLTHDEKKKILQQGDRHEAWFLWHDDPVVIN